MGFAFCTHIDSPRFGLLVCSNSLLKEWSKFSGPLYDALRTIVVGASFGAPFALAAAAQDPSISGVVLIHGFGDIPGTGRFRILQSWKSRFGPLTNPLAWLLSRLG